MGEKRKRKDILKLVAILVVVMAGTVLFLGAVSGWFSGPKLALDEEYICSEDDPCDELMNIVYDEYENLISDEGSFILFVDQDGCETADRLRGYVQDWAKEARVRVYRIMFADLKKTSLHEQVKYYPSVVMISDGKVIDYLKADADGDAKKYNDYEVFRAWMLGHF